MLNESLEQRCHGPLFIVILHQIKPNSKQYFFHFKGTAVKLKRCLLNQELTEVKGSKNRQHLSFPIYLISVRMNKYYSTRSPCSLSLSYLWVQIGISPVANEIGCINGIAPFSKCQLRKRECVHCLHNPCAKLHLFCNYYVRSSVGKFSYCGTGRFVAYLSLCLYFTYNINECRWDHKVL